MNSTFRILSLFLLFFSANSFAEVSCITSAKDHESAKEKLPKLFQEIPVKVGVDQPGLVYDIFATVRISFIGDTIVLRTDSWQGPYGMYNDLSEVKSVCFNAETKEMVIKFKNDKTEDFKAKYTNTSVTIPEAGSKPAIELTKLTSAQERAILEKINRKIPASKRQPVDAQSKQKELN